MEGSPVQDIRPHVTVSVKEVKQPPAPDRKLEVFDLGAGFVKY
jgi:hypothetical protein